MNTTDIEYIAHHRSSDGEIQSIADHLTGVSRLAKTFADKIGIGLAGELIGLLHDLGKYSKQFQGYIKSGSYLINPDEDDFVDVQQLKGKVDHSTAGAQYIWQQLSGCKQPIPLYAQIMALCIASHHSGLIDNLKLDGQNNFKQRMNKVDEKTHLAEVRVKADPYILEKSKILISNLKLFEEIHKKVGQILTVNHLEHIDEKDNKALQFQLGLLVRFLFSCLIDADRIDTADFENPKAAQKRLLGNYENWPVLIDRLEKHLAQFPLSAEKINQTRQKIAQYCYEGAAMSKGVFTLTVPTGGGKTLASLRFALHHAQSHKMDHIFYIIPFTSIIEQNAKVVRDILETGHAKENSIILELHSNLTPSVQTWRNKILSESWDAPIIYTTMVQFLETLFNGGTRDARRMHQLANSIIIFDEIQTLPIRCVRLFCNAINFLADQCGSSILLCTATQPLLNELQDKEKGCLILSKERELMPDVDDLFNELKRVDIINNITLEGWTDEQIASLAVQAMEEAQSCLVIVNTKQSAKSVFEQCKSLTAVSVYHLSTNMCPAHRADTLNKIKQKLGNEPLICISTQLIEAGVDIDFGSVIRALAGLDAIAQAAGRCNRHGRSLRGKVYIVNPQQENLDRLPDIKAGREKTRRILAEMNEDPELARFDLLAPEIMNRYFEYYFFDRSSEMDYPISQNTELERDDNLLNLLSTNPINNSTNYDYFPNTLRQAFMTGGKIFQAFDSPTQGVIVYYGAEGEKLINQLLSAYNIEQQYHLLKKAQAFTVNIYPHQFKKLIEGNAVHEIQEGLQIYYLDREYYSELFGLSEIAVKTLENQII